MVIVLICDRFSGKLKVNFIQHAIISLFVGFSTSTGLVFKTFYFLPPQKLEQLMLRPTGKTVAGIFCGKMNDSFSCRIFNFRMAF